MEATNPTERVQWLTEQYDLSTKNAQALILSELGYSHSGIAAKLGVTQSTARTYVSTLESQIGEGVTQALPKDVRYPTFPGDTPKREVPYSGDKVNLSPEFSKRERPLAKGTSISEIDKSLITIRR